MREYGADARRHGVQDRSQRISREELTLVQATHIADRLGLDKKTTDRFTETYSSFQQEIWNIGPRPGRLSPDAGEEETGEYLRSRFTQSHRILDLREKYYNLYSEFLTQKQIQQAYRIEREMMDRLSETLKNISYSGTSISLCSDKTAALIMHAALRLPSPFLPEADFVLFSFSPFHTTGSMLFPTGRMLQPRSEHTVDRMKRQRFSDTAFSLQINKTRNYLLFSRISKTINYRLQAAEVVMN